MKKKDLDSLRSRLLETDRQLIRLLNERARLAAGIGEYKRSRGMDVYDPARESLIYAHVEQAGKGPLPPEALKAIFGEIVSASRNLQKEFSVACLGPEASFTHQAARRHFGSSAAMKPKATVCDVFEEVERGRADCGVVPLENSLEGSVKMTLDRLITTPLHIVGDTYLPVSHCLLSKASRPEEVTTIYSHPQALAQCRNWIRHHMPSCSLREEESTALAARKVLRDPSGAAIASREAADLYGLTVLASAIEDHRANITRFIILGTTPAQRTGRDKTSLIFTVRHEPGSLLRSLEPFASKGINLTRIVSHPVRERTWEYLFFVDFLGHVAQQQVTVCLDELGRESTFLKVLGSYPAGEGGIVP
ncbi:MAG: prephenate dehydratase [Syntrophales bacterium]|jgi:chorismate mutase/prephenate dehydratase|nr:prephenate dehydratase [Syntrophales bacterium]MCK9527388.1 prephenate dehydratase [Syntrophales bacterium]MDX9921490.1 prephenate dehydratase [Syntrophales bacterium]